MPRGVNRVTLIGYVGVEPTISVVSGEGRVASWSLATTSQWWDKGGQKQERVQWHRVVAWNNSAGGGLASVVERFVHSGSRIYVEGRIVYRKWQDKDGTTRYGTDIVASEIALLGPSSGTEKAEETAAESSEGNREDAGGDDVGDDDGGGDDDLPF